MSNKTERETMGGRGQKGAEGGKQKNTCDTRKGGKALGVGWEGLEGHTG